LASRRIVVLRLLGSPIYTLGLGGSLPAEVGWKAGIPHWIPVVVVKYMVVYDLAFIIPLH
jgi:hypothetical protein